MFKAVYEQEPTFLCKQIKIETQTLNLLALKVDANSTEKAVTEGTLYKL